MGKYRKTWCPTRTRTWKSGYLKVSHVFFILLHHCTGDLDDGESLRALIISMEELFGMHIVAALLVFVKNSDVIPL